MIKIGLFGPIAVLLLGCSAHIDRKGTPNAWYYERLTPYYTNDLYLSPRVHLRAVRELVGQETVLADGTPAHADIFRDDIELFFARPIDDPKERARLIDEALLNTCPDTDRSDLRSRITYADQTYIVLQHVSCIGYATHGS